MRILSISSLMMICLCFTYAARAEDIALPQPESVLTLSDSDSLKKGYAVSYELSTSNWFPQNFTRPSYGSTSSEFTNYAPMMSVSRLSSWIIGDVGTLKTELGIYYSEAIRTGQTRIGGGGPLTYDEIATFTGLRFGLNYEFSKLWTSQLQPMVGVAVLPSWVSAQQNPLEPNGISELGIVGEASIKLYYFPRFMQKADMGNGNGIGLGVHYIAGSIASSDLSGLGYRLSLRFSL